MSDTGPSSDSNSNVNKNIATKFENESDLLIYYSTLPNHLSWSNDKKEATIFIKSFCDVFAKAYENLPNNMSLSEMFTIINKSVSKTGQQISEVIYRMKEEVKFLPKDVSKHFYIFLHRRDLVLYFIDDFIFFYRGNFLRCN